MKKFTFKGVLDGFRSSVQAAPRVDQEIQETLRPEHFQIKKTFRHGFPHNPTAIAWDPIQKLLAIGDKGGSIRILGGPGVDTHCRHESGASVLHARFVLNEGALVTATADDHVHLWNFRQTTPVRVHALKFQRERITCIHLPLQSRWLHVGTERGNVHHVHVETFVLSGYVINWNKAIEVTRSNHPGAVVDVCDNPLDASKLLIAFESGLVVVWDLRSRAAEWRGCLGTGLPGDGIRAAAWQHDGKFMTAHVDGALATWTMRGPRPGNLTYPHAKTNKDGKLEACKPIHRLEWKTSRAGESFVIFSGGLPTDKAGKTHSVTVLNGKNTTVLEMEHNVVDFITLCESPWTADYQEPYAIVVLLQNDLVVIDLQTPGYPCFENPYPMDIHESPVTCCSYFADCPSDLIPAFYSVGRQGNKKTAGFSDKLWPIDGGEWSPASCSYSEIILTGHADGSVKFWDASAGTLQILYKLKCSKVFERRGGGLALGGGGAGGGGGLGTGGEVVALALCAESRRLALALPQGHVLLFKFRRSENTHEVQVIEVPPISETLQEETSPEQERSSSALDNESRRFSSARGSVSGGACGGGVGGGTGGGVGTGAGGGAGGAVVRGAAGTGGARRGAGFQPALCALQAGAAHAVSAIAIHHHQGLLAWGGERGVVLVDMFRRVLVVALPACALYSPRAPPLGVSAPLVPAPGAAVPEPPRQRSPSLEQLEEASRHSPLPATSPADLATSLPDDPPPSDKLEMRRKSTPWKTFNLKRQLSKVDLKLKAAFTTPVETAVEAVEKGSQFYCDAPPSKCDAPALESTTESPENELENRGECEPTCSDKDDLPSPLRVCSDVFERMHKELQEKRSSDASENMHKELQEKWQEKDGIEVSPDISPSKLGEEEETKAVRPHNLPLFEDDLAPSRPPRQKEKKKKDDSDKRDQRLLSVPNIKYSKPEAFQDLRRKQSAQQTSFAGNIMRRFRQFLARICKRNQDDDNTDNNEQEFTAKRIEPTIPQTLASMEYLHIMQPSDKLDNSFSRSRSSSMSSLENISQEGIQCIAFADSYIKKSDPSSLVPALWIGTTLGSVLTMMINLPEAENRHTQPVVVSTSGGPIFRLKGSILAMSFLDCNGALIPYSYESWKDDTKEVRDRRERTPTKQSSSGSGTRMSPTPITNEAGDRQFVVIASEKQARVVALPSQNCVYRQQIVDTDFVVKAEIVSLKDSVCLVNYLSTGHLVAYSLPSLRPLVDIDFLPLSELRIAKTFCFSNRGHGLYLASPSEIQKFTIDAEFCQQLTEMVGELFLPRDMPEPPKEGFFKGLFGGGSRPLDREELFGEGSGKPNRATVKHVAGPNANLEQLGGRASTAASEVSRAHMLVLERGDKLSQLEDKTERMHNQAAEFGSSAHQLMMKYKDKKWYQL